MAETMLQMMESMVDSARRPDNAQRDAGTDRGSSPGRLQPYFDSGGWRPPAGRTTQGHDRMASTAHLQGSWTGNGGERLVIGGTRFRLQAGSGRVAEGLVSVRGELLEFYSPALDHTWVYEFAEHEGRLALRDADGRLYLFRRGGRRGRR